MVFLENADPPKHTGGERFTRSFALREQGSDYDIRGEYVQFEFRPEMVYVVWERALGGTWQRANYFKRGSRIEGHRVLKSGELGDQTAMAQVFTRQEFTDYAHSIPGLVEAVKEAEKGLPE
jgi:hypothetical protein